MHRFAVVRLVLAGLVLVGSVRAETPPDLLRFIPAEADLLIEVKHPGKIVEAITSLEILPQLQQLSAVQEQLDSTNLRRFRQLLAYLERELGGKWPELLERSAGGGAALAIKYAPQPAPALFVFQGRDEATQKKALALFLQVAEQEVARQESKDRLERHTCRGIDTFSLGKEFHAAVSGTALFVSNKEAGLKLALDLALDGPQKSLVGNPSVAAARKLLPPNPLVSLWANLEPVHQLPQAKEIYKLPRNDALQTIVLGGVLEAIGRSRYLAAGTYRDQDGFVTTVRMPAGRQGVTEGIAVHVPPADIPGTRPLLEPKGTLYSSSFYLDVSRFWEDRGKLFNETQVKQFEQFNETSGRFLAGTKFSELLRWAGPYHRVVAAHQPRPGYTRKPQQALPAFAVVSELREPEEFGKAMETILRGAALLAGTQARIKLVEEKHGEHRIVGYRFPEDATLKQDVYELRYNFSPCFARVGNQFLVSSTVELAHELLDVLEADAKNGDQRGSPAMSVDQLYAAGAAEYLSSIEGFLLTQTVLDQALPLDQARTQVKRFLDLLRQGTTLRIESAFGEKDFRYDVRLNLGR